MKEGVVYILSNAQQTVFYTGVTSDLVNRVYQHKQGNGSKFTARYKMHFLMYYEQHQSMYQAIQREKHIKKWNREWKMNLIKSINPEMRDLWSDILPEGRFHF